MVILYNNIMPVDSCTSCEAVGNWKALFKKAFVVQAYRELRNISCGEISHNLFFGGFQVLWILKIPTNLMCVFEFLGGRESGVFMML